MNCLRDRPLKEQPAALRGPAVKSKSVFFQKVVQVRRLNRSQVSSQEPAPQERCDSVGQGQKVDSQIRRLANDLMLVAQSQHYVITTPAIRIDLRSRVDHFLYRRFATLACGFCNPPQANSADPYFCLVCLNDEQRLARSPTAPLSGPFSSNKEFIDLDYPASQSRPGQTMARRNLWGHFHAV